MEEILDMPKHGNVNVCSQVRGKKNLTLTHFIWVYSRLVTFSLAQSFCCCGRTWHLVLLFLQSAVHSYLDTHQVKGKVKLRRICWKHPALRLFKTACVRTGVCCAIKTLKGWDEEEKKNQIKPKRSPKSLMIYSIFLYYCIFSFISPYFPRSSLFLRSVCS